MASFKYFAYLCLYAGLAVLFSAVPAHAYLDPGSGSVLLQLVLGGAAGVAVLTRAYWHRLRLRFRPSRHHKAKSGPGNDSR